ncbi:MAG: hypothetical protein MR675_00755 [Lachnospira sp.]|nr:hypothetical protein [Lachnospira sp.]MDD5828810.1 hypothetical protein [Lachnospira sp.]
MSEITYEALKGLKDLKSLPILTLDERWYHLVTDKIKTDEIRYWEKEVNELLKKQGQVNTDIKEVKKIKSQIIKEVVENMEDDSSNNKKKMTQNQRLIKEAKDKISQLEDESLELPRKLARANEQLMLETVKVCFEKINSNKEDLEVLNKWIDSTRVKLKKNLLIKQDKEAVNEKMYTYMHDIFGAEIMGTLDRINEGSEGE